MSSGFWGAWRAIGAMTDTKRAKRAKRAKQYHIVVRNRRAQGPVVCTAATRCSSIETRQNAACLRASADCTRPILALLDRIVVAWTCGFGTRHIGKIEFSCRLKKKGFETSFLFVVSNSTRSATPKNKKKTLGARAP